MAEIKIEEKKKGSGLAWLWIILLLIIIAVAGWFWYNRDYKGTDPYNNDRDTTRTEQPADSF